MPDWQQAIAVAWPLLVALVLGLLVRHVLLGIARRARMHVDTHTFARVVRVWVWASMGSGIGRIANRHEAAPYKYVASLGHFTPAQLPGAKRVTAAEVQQLIAQGAQMVDVRSEKEYNEGHIPGARLVPYGEKSLKDIAFDAKADSFAGVDKLDKEKPVIFACNGAECWKSYKASKAAVERGFKQVYWFRGGLPEWRTQGLPVDGRAATNNAKL